MQNINTLYKDARKVVRTSCGNVLGKITKVETESRKKKCWGTCTHDHISNTYEIKISTKILKDEIPYEKALSVVVHELLHTCRGCNNHGAK